MSNHSSKRLHALRQKLQHQQFTSDLLAKPADIYRLIRLMRPNDSGIPLVRIGPDADGGHLVPDDLEGVKACFSSGCGNAFGFELDCHRRGMQVYMVDGSVEELANLSANMHFMPKYLMTKVERTDVHLSDFKKGCITLPKWLNQTGLKTEDDLLLQMDIGGFEYDILLAQSRDLLNRFRIMTIEFHALDLLCIESFRAEVEQLFLKLLKTHDIVHIQPNHKPQKLILVNGIEMPMLLEITFLRKNRMRKKKVATRFPHPLDPLNVPHENPVKLPEMFYRDRPETWKYSVQNKLDLIKKRLSKYAPTEFIKRIEKKQLISGIYQRGHIPAIVNTCDRYAAMTQHMIRCYETLWPDHPFEFLVPYQDVSRIEKHDRMHFIRTGKGIKETIITLLDGFSDDQLVFWCIDDRYPMEIDVSSMNSLTKALLANQYDDLFCLNLESLIAEKDLNNPVLIGDVQFYPCRRYIRYWRHKFIRVGYLRLFLQYIPQIVPFPQIIDSILAQKLRPMADLYRVHDVKLPLAIYGESTFEGRMTKNCHESFRRYGLDIPRGFEVEHELEITTLTILSKQLVKPG